MNRKVYLILITVIIVFLIIFLIVPRLKMSRSHTEVEFNDVNSQLIIREKQTGNAYTVRFDNNVTIVNSKKDGQSLILTGIYRVNEQKYNPIKFSVKAEKEGGIGITLEVTGQYSMSEPVYLEVVTPAEGEQFFVIPYAEGMLLPAEEGYPFNEFYMWGYKATMPFVGLTDLRQGLMVISENPWDTSVKFTKYDAEQNYHMQIRLWPAKGSYSEPRKLLFTTVSDEGYVAMSEHYHRYRGNLETVLTLKAKSNENHNMGKLLGACDFWLLEDLGNREFINRLMNLGVKKAIFSFYKSWYVYEHEQVPDLIHYAEDQGFLAGRYDIDTDVWNPQEIPSHLLHIRTDAYPEDVVVKSGGDMQKNWTRYLNGKPVDGYIVCSSAFWKYGKVRIENDLADNSYNTRFFDSILSVALMECYSSQHPLTRQEDMQQKKAYLESVRDKFGLILGSEDIRDYAVNQVDYNEGVLTITAVENAAYSWREPVENPEPEYERYNMDASRRIPLFQLVYHNSLASTWYTGDSVSKVPSFWKRKDLFTVLYGAMPLIMPQNLAHWNEREGDFLSSIHLAGAFYECVGAERMVSHQFISSDRLVQKTLFSNGWEVVGNFSDKNIHHGKYTLPPDGFYATNGVYEIYRVLHNNSLLDVVSLKDRLFINPYGNEVTLEGITTDEVTYIDRRQKLHLPNPVYSVERCVDSSKKTGS